MISCARFSFLPALLVAFPMSVVEHAAATEPTRTLNHPNPVTALALSPDGKIVATGDTSKKRGGLIYLWDVSTGRQRTVLKGHSLAIAGLSFAADNRMLASVSFDDLLKLWDVETGREIATVSKIDKVVDVAFVGKSVLATRAAARPPQLWDVKNPKNVSSITPQQNLGTWCDACAFSRDGKLVAMAFGHLSRAVEITIREVPSGKEVASFQGPKNEPVEVAFSPDSKTLAVGYRYADTVVELWNVSNGKKAGLLKGHKMSIHSLSFSPDGKVLASGDYNGVIRIWDIPTQKVLATLEAHGGNVSYLVFSANGKMLVSGSYDGKVKLWDADKLVVKKPAQDKEEEEKRPPCRGRKGIRTLFSVR